MAYETPFVECLSEKDLEDYHVSNHTYPLPTHPASVIVAPVIDLFKGSFPDENEV
jgi:hypothetical protein